MPEPVITTHDLSVSARQKILLNPVSLEIPRGGVFGIIGPSGAGKSTFLKSLNRLSELSPGLKVSGQVRLEGDEIYGSSIDVDALRARIGILFQQPVIFPKSILANVLFGVRHLGVIPKGEWDEVAEKALRQASLWEEVKDRLKKPGQQLSIGQQQRLCLARTLATGTQVILMDEPTSALDPRSTEAIEGLIQDLGDTHSIVLVTHNMRQAERLCQDVAFIGLRDGVGTLLTQGALPDLLSKTDVPELDEYLCCERPGIVASDGASRVV